MDFQEILALGLGGFLAVRVWGRLFLSVLELPEFAVKVSWRLAVLAVPILCCLILFAVLHFWSADDVRGTPWMLYYLVVGAGWMAACDCGIQLLGISLRDDALERRNAAAFWACAGALAGCTLSFAGANVGNGPGVHVVVYSGLLSAGALFGTWFAIEHLVSPALSERISVERETAAGVRLGGLLAGLGIVLGWSVAGDWNSIDQTHVDFLQSAWPPVLAAVVVALPVEWMLAKRPEGSVPSVGFAFFLACLYIATGGAYVAHQVGLW